MISWLAEQMIDPAVDLRIVRVEPDLRHGDGVVMYGVSDGERSGLWLARLAQ
jgi:hypothetical protein